jgi:hypothetical protein
VFSINDKKLSAKEREIIEKKCDFADKIIYWNRLEDKESHTGRRTKQVRVMYEKNGKTAYTTIPLTNAGRK